jgi:hypothetical protein
MTLNESVRPIEVLRCQAVTADTNGTAVDVHSHGRPQEILFLVDSATPTGTTPTMIVKIEHSDDNSTWEAAEDSDGDAITIPSFNTAGLREVNYPVRKRYVRPVYDVGGTTPSFTMCVLAIAGNALEGPI